MRSRTTTRDVRNRLCEGKTNSSKSWIATWVSNFQLIFLEYGTRAMRVAEFWKDQWKNKYLYSCVWLADGIHLSYDQPRFLFRSYNSPSISCSSLTSSNSTMCEVIGLAASVLAIAQLTGSLVTAGYGYINSFKRAPFDVQLFVEKLSEFNKVLRCLQDYVGENPNSTVLQELGGDGGPLQRCEEELKRLQTRLQWRAGIRGVVDHFKWPLKESETLRHTQAIEGYRSTFSLALGMDNLWVMMPFSSQEHT